MTTTKVCRGCKQEIPMARLEVLPEAVTCVCCSKEQKYVGSMIFDHKTAPRLVYVNPDNIEALETLRRFVRRARR